MDAEATAGKIDLNYAQYPRDRSECCGIGRRGATTASARAPGSPRPMLPPWPRIGDGHRRQLRSVPSPSSPRISDQSSETSAQAGYNNADWIYPEVPAAGISKDQLEGPLRSLASLGTTRTWRLGVDLVVQVGRYAPGAADPARDFIVEAQQRYFDPHLRSHEGRLISRTMEPVYE